MENFEINKAMYKKQIINPKISVMGAAIFFIEHLSIPKTFGTIICMCQKFSILLIINLNF